MRRYHLNVPGHSYRGSVDRPSKAEAKTAIMKILGLKEWPEGWWITGGTKELISHLPDTVH